MLSSLQRISGQLAIRQMVEQRAILLGLRGYLDDIVDEFVRALPTTPVSGCVESVWAARLYIPLEEHIDISQSHA
jgi:hypothetical protein